MSSRVEAVVAGLVVASVGLLLVSGNKSVGEGLRALYGEDRADSYPTRVHRTSKGRFPVVMVAGAFAVCVGVAIALLGGA